MAGLARSYCSSVAQDPAYQALLATISSGDQEKIRTQVDLLTEKIESFATHVVQRMLQHDLEAEVNGKHTPDWYKQPNPDELGPLSAAFDQHVLEPFRPKYPSNLSSGKQFLLAMRSQSEKFLPEWYTRTESKLKEVRILEHVH